MRKYLVDVPVKINIWIRPECQQLQWDVIRQARPSILFIQSDGGRNEKEWAVINESRKMIEDSIDWECKVYKIYEEKNLGLYTMGIKRNQIIWSLVDRCIFLEDDQIPSLSYFKFCEELLEKYKDDLRIECICGMNHLGISENVTSDYFFSRQGSIWGFATWRNRFHEDKSFQYINDDYIRGLLKYKTKHDAYTWNRIIGYASNEKYENHVAGSEFWIDFNMYAQERVQIIPKYNMISNIGCLSNSEHSTEYKYLDHATKKVFCTPTYELEFPLKHPDYVIADDRYMQKRDWIMGRNHRIVTFLRKIESRVYKLIYGGIREVFSTKRKKHES